MLRRVGRFDAYYEAGLSPWDAAAGELIAREAGCRSGRLRRRPADPAELLVATPAIFDDMARSQRRHVRDDAADGSPIRHH